jgi:hypothetical protein
MTDLAKPEAKYRLGELIAAIPFTFVELLAMSVLSLLVCSLSFMEVNGVYFTALYLMEPLTQYFARAYEVVDGLHDLFEIDMGGGTWLFVIELRGAIVALGHGGRGA